jgi:hypothetical protein
MTNENSISCSNAATEAFFLLLGPHIPIYACRNITIVGLAGLGG